MSSHAPRRRLMRFLTAALIAGCTTGALAFGSASAGSDPGLVAGSRTTTDVGDKIIEGRIVAQDLRSSQICNVGNVVARELNPANVRGCTALDDVKVVAYDANRNVLASALSYASERADGPAHGYYYLHVPPGRNYYLEFSKPGWNREAVRRVDVPKRGRGTRVWAGLVKPDLDSDLSIAKKQRRTFSYCEQIPIGFSLRYDRPSMVPQGYPVAPYGYMFVTYRGDSVKIPGSIKQKFEGRFTVTLNARFFRPGEHFLSFRYTGLDFRGTFPDVRASRTTFSFRTTACGGGRPAARATGAASSGSPVLHGPARS